MVSVRRPSARTDCARPRVSRGRQRPLCASRARSLVPRSRDPLKTEPGRLDLRAPSSCVHGASALELRRARCAPPVRAIKPSLYATACSGIAPGSSLSARCQDLDRSSIRRGDARPPLAAVDLAPSLSVCPISTDVPRVSDVKDIAYVINVRSISLQPRADLGSTTCRTRSPTTSTASVARAARAAPVSPTPTSARPTRAVRRLPLRCSLTSLRARA